MGIFDTGGEILFQEISCEVQQYEGYRKVFRIFLKTETAVVTKYFLST